MLLRSLSWLAISLRHSEPCAVAMNTLWLLLHTSSDVIIAAALSQQF